MSSRPDGTTLYTAGADKVVKAWKIASEAPTKTLQHPNLVDAVAFNNTGTQLATGCHDGKVRIWDVAKGQVVKEINAHPAMPAIPGQQPQPAPVYCVVWSADGKQVLSGSLDTSLKLWDAASGNLVKEFKGYKEKDFEKGHREGVFTAAFSPDGKSIVSGSSDRSIKVWNVADGSVTRELVNPNLKPAGWPVAHPGWVYSLRFLPDGRLVSVGGAPRNHGFLATWDVNQGKMLTAEELPLGAFYSVAVVVGRPAPGDRRRRRSVGQGGQQLHFEDAEGELASRGIESSRPTGPRRAASKTRPTLRASVVLLLVVWFNHEDSETRSSSRPACRSAGLLSDAGIGPTVACAQTGSRVAEAHRRHGCSPHRRATLAGGGGRIRPLRLLCDVHRHPEVESAAAARRVQR